MRKNKLLLLLALLLTAATGAWAQESATTYSVKMKANTQDAKNWSIASGEKSAKGDAADGLTGLSEKDAVTLTYTGRLKVKGVKATSDAAPAPSVPDGALSGVFSVSDSKKVYFSKGNLRYASGAWSFFDNQYDYYESYSADAWDHLGWSTSATTYGMNTSEYNSSYSGDFVDWGAMMGAGWFTLSSDEWKYLINTRSASTVNGTENGRYAKAKVNNVGGVIIFPDTYTHPDGVAAPTGVNSTLSTGWNGNSYTVADWTKMESAGCVFLPAAGYREGSSVSNPGTYGRYWSATPNGLNYAYGVLFTSDVLNPAYEFTRYRGCSVRLVREVATSDAAPAPAAPALNITSPSVGQVIGSDGKNYAYGSLPTGVTAVAMIAKVSGSNGLAIALADEEGEMNYDTAVTTAAAHTPAFTGVTWKLPTQDEWKQMFAANGDEYNYSGLNTAIKAAGGTALQGDAYYWSSTEDGDYVYAVFLDVDDVTWDSYKKDKTYRVRPCLAF